MDDGAHFFKADFQVHTPRDINWKGAGAVTTEERQLYADEFIAACRAKQLQAVAITDHHDVAFFRYIRDAAARETDAHGKQLSAEQRIVVFPGVELTLAVPCQALLILDADFPPELLPQVLLALNVKPAPTQEAEPKHTETAPLEDFRSLTTLYDSLQKVDILKDRFIVLPHVGEGGKHTVLRNGFAPEYKRMPCVGGFVDGAVTQHGLGNQTILAGKNKEWGNKPLAVFQTSDNRARDFAQLGSHVTWVKWARPTAEALRQACLARHSRISVQEPRMPGTRITRIEVTNSKFLGPVVLELNPQYNALIGGRGTGKSTLLEYLRWALCDQPAAADADDELADFQKRRTSLVANTLIPLGAAIDVAFVLDAVPHVVRRKATGELLLQIASGPFEPCSEDNVRALLPIRAYSQKQLSAVGARLEELRRFVYAPIQSSLNAIEERIAGLRADLRAEFARLERYRALQAEVSAHRLERESLLQRIQKLREALQGLSPEDQSVIDRQPEYEAEQRAAQAIDRDVAVVQRTLDGAITEISKLPTKFELRSGTPNRKLLDRVHAAQAQIIDELQEGLRILRARFDESSDDSGLHSVTAQKKEWQQKREAHRQQYEEAKKRATAHEETLGQIQTLEVRQEELTVSADEKAQQLEALGAPEVQFFALRAQWKQLYRERADALAAQCLQLTTLSNGRLRATLNRAADTAPLVERIIQMLRGTKVRADKVEQIAQHMKASTDPLEGWSDVLTELLYLAQIRVDDEATTVLPSTPRLESAGMTAKERLAIARHLQPAAWIDLALFDLEDLPTFEYQVRAGDYIAFHDASPGQQATVLLSILLSQDGPPLLIDQPEDDLNMKAINDVVETLWDAKTHRQVIFVSHNANLVVNGDAELVVCCDYRTSGTESGGKIKFTGAIDVPDIRTEITEVMEGGAEAFQLRHTKYGF